MPPFFTTDTLAVRDTVLFHPLQAATTHQPILTHLRQPLPTDNDLIVALLLTAAILLAITLYHTHTIIREHLATLLLPSSHTPAAEGPHALQAPVITAFATILTLSIAILYHHYATTQPPAAPLQPWWLPMPQMLSLYTLTAIAYLLLRRTLITIVHATFLPPTTRRAARQSILTTMLLLSTLLYLAALATTFLHLAAHTMWIIVIVSLLFVKIISSWKLFPYVSTQKYGLAHFFVYFCALEAAPLTLLWSTLHLLTTTLAAT